MTRDTDFKRVKNDPEIRQAAEQLKHLSDIATIGVGEFTPFQQSFVFEQQARSEKFVEEFALTTKQVRLIATLYHQHFDANGRQKS